MDSGMSPNSTAADVMTDVPVRKIARPPMSKAASERGFARPSSAGDNDAPSARRDDDPFGLSSSFTARRRNTIDDVHRLSVSDTTRGILDKMDESQVQEAMEAFKTLTQRRKSERGMAERRRLSGLKMQSGKRRSSRRTSDESLEGAAAKVADFDNNNEARSRRESRGSESSGLPDRKFSQSIPNELEGLDESYESYESDGEEDRLEGLAKEAGRRGNEIRLSKSLGATGDDAYAMAEEWGDEDEEEEDGGEEGDEGFNPIGRSLGQLKEVEESTDETFARIVRRHSNEHGERLVTARFSEPVSKRKSPRQRRAGMLSMSCSAAGEVQTTTWKPLSSVQRDLPPEEDEEAKKRKEEEAKKNEGGFGGFWNKLTSGFTAEKEPASQPRDDSKLPEPKKEINGATYFRKGQRRANKGQFLQAVALFNFALVRQREELGENHVDCGTTLNEIGVCWMMLGERYPALTAFEEALYIRQRALGDGAREVAETTNNIWMILHEERTELEDMMAEDNEEDE